MTLPEEYIRNFPSPRRGRGCFPGRVCAAVLTYNRKELLEHCLAALLAQSDPPERILVLDNASTDGTAELVARFGDPRIEHVRLERNIGAAGGFARMFRHVYDAGWEWGWFLDDDVIAAPDALAELKRAFADNFMRAEDVAYLISNAVTPDGKPNCVPDIDHRLAAGDCAQWGELLADGIVRIRISALNSILIPRSTLADHGAPSKDFVVWGEDTDWSLRATERLPALLAGRSRIVHVRGASGELDPATEPDPQRIGRFFYLFRNTVYMRRAYWPPHGVWLFLGRALFDLGRCLFARNHRAKRAYAVLSGTVAGFFFRPRFHPFREAPHARTRAAAAMAEVPLL
jgi:GT2 family glycosyltransferase